MQYLSDTLPLLQGKFMTTIYLKDIPSVAGGLWGWTWRLHDGSFWARHASYKTYEDAQDALETFMVKKWADAD